MKKTFPLHLPGKEDKRVLEMIKLELTKYVKRERRKTLPPERNAWDFECKVGSVSESVSEVAFSVLFAAVEAVAVADADEVHVEILAVPRYREKKAASSPSQRRDW